MDDECKTCLPATLSLKEVGLLPDGGPLPDNRDDWERRLMQERFERRIFGKKSVPVEEITGESRRTPVNLDALIFPLIKHRYV